MTITDKQITDRIIEVFGPPQLSGVGLKLGEEFGEVARALVRIIEGRPGDWVEELKGEIGDLGVVLSQICHTCGFDLIEAIEAGKQKFMNREWDTQKWDREIE